MNAAALTTFLDEASAALDAGDVHKAAASVSRAAELCGTVARPDATMLSRLESVYLELVEKTRLCHQALVAEARAMDRAQRARGAYQQPALAKRY